MARKATSFKVIPAKKVIVLYEGITATEAEQTVINAYLANGFTPKFETKKASETVADMREALKKDADALAKFNELYAEKDKGFHKACKYYADWKKNNK